MSVPGNSCRASTSYLSNTGCIIKLPGECVSYTGASIAGPGINTGDLLNTAIAKLAAYSSAGGGGVTSVGLTMPAAFTVGGSPITSSGILAVSAVGNSSQYIAGNGTLVTFPTIPTVPSFENGINLLAGVVRLGGSLTGATTITGTAGTHSLTLTSPSITQSLNVINTAGSGSPVAIRAENTTSAGYAILAAGGSGNAILATGVAGGIRSQVSGASATALTGTASGVSGVGLFASSTNLAIVASTIGGKAFDFNKQELTTNNIYYLGSMSALSISNAPTPGFGVGFDFRLSTNPVVPGGSTDISNQIASYWTDSAFATRTSNLAITGVNNAVTNSILTLAGSGRVSMDMYGAGSFTGGTATYTLGVDSSGNVMELSIGGGGTVTSFTFTDGNGFDGTVTTGTTTPTLSLTTTVSDAQVMYSNSGALAGHAGFIHQLTGGFNNLTLGTGTANQGGILNFSYGTDAGGALVSKFNGTSMMQFGFNNSAQFAGSSGANSGRTFYIYDEIGVAYRAGMGGDGTLYVGPSSASYGLAVQQPTSGTSMTILSNGFVGIGNSSPITPLDIIDPRVSTPASQVHIGTAATGGIYVTGIAGDGYMSNSQYNGTNWIARATYGTIVAYAATGAVIYVDGGLTAGNSYSPTARLTILNAGNVGIATTSPTAKLHVYEPADAHATLLVQASSVTKAAFIDTIDGAGVDMRMQSNGTYGFIGAVTNHDTQLVANGGPVLTLKAAGNVSIGTTTPNAAALLQLDSTTRGFLPPRMDTTQRDAISAVAGLMIYNTSTNKLNFYNGSTWEVITSA